MSDCSNHKKEVAGISDMKQLAEMIGDLHYETLAQLFYHLGSKLKADASKDLQDDKVLLAASLANAAIKIDLAWLNIKKAFEISKPFMSPPNSKQ